MKTIKYALLGLVFVTFACEEISDPSSVIQYQQKLSEYFLEAEAALSNIYTIVDLTVRNPNVIAGDTVSVMGADVYMVGTVMSINYGNGSTGPDGITRSGMIKVNQTNDYLQAGGQLDVSFDNYVVGGKDVGGTFQVVNQGNNAFGLVATDFFTNPEFDLDATKTLSWSAGFSTDDDQDDEYALTGMSTGTDSTNNSVTADIMSPLTFRRNCEFAVIGGIMDLTFDIDSLTTAPSGTLDFLMDDDCDNLVKITVKNGEQEVETFVNIEGFGL